MSNNKYQPTIGLEIHAELKTRTKMFCRCLNDSNEKHPNINICPICMGHPGTLPVINEEAVKKVLMAGKALNGKLADYSRFDRKNYFYPDLPKGYQISQHKYPLVEGGYLEIRNSKHEIRNKSKILNTKYKIHITRVHLEEDAGRLIHEARNMNHEAQKKVSSFKFQGLSYVDFNRAGVPLMELVTEPDIKSGEEAKEFAKELQLILRYLDVSDADMEKGQMRIETNVSLRSAGNSVSNGNRVSALGTKVEIKNLNSFRAAERAINYEIERQAELLDKGEKIKHETRGWDENKQKTFSQREKEKSHDYRYFPEPDLPPLTISNLKSQISNLPELPQKKRERFKKEFGLRDEQIEILTADKKLADYFEEAISELKTQTPSVDAKTLGVKIQLAANYLITDLAGDLSVAPENFAKLISMIAENKITSRAAKDVLKIMFETGAGPETIVEEKGLRQTSDESEIDNLAKKLIKENPKSSEDYKKGKEAALQFLIGQGMKETMGSINPDLLKNALKNNLS